MTRLLVAALLALGCAARGPAAPAEPAGIAAAAPAAATPAPASAAPPRLADVPRDRFNRAALTLGLPLFWNDDRDRDGALVPDELAVIWGLDPRPRTHWVKDGAFTPAFAEAYARVRAHAASAPAPADAQHAALGKEISQSYFTVLESDFRNAPAEDRAIVRHVLAAADHIERIYARQLGTAALAARVPAGDGLAKLVYFLNQGPWCSGPATEKDPACTAIMPAPPRLSGLYPADLQATRDFCAKLEADAGSTSLTAPFTAVTRDPSGKLAALPYSQVYPEEMAAVRRELEAAAAAIQDPAEAAFKTYLLAAAKAFGDDDWFAADEAWSRMTATNSKWFLRIGPDEVYFEPCNLKGGFHVSFARIDPSSLAWQKRLEPVKNDMEQALAALAGQPYRARSVSFNIPDFIQVVLNAGDSRDPRGATIGQSLPNWGPVANEGRGRTVAMTNFYEDPESRAVGRSRAESLLCKETMARYADDADAKVMGTVLHEAAHNLGPSHEYEVNGKTDDQIFGGPLASTLEELKAQSSALYLTDWLVAKGVLDQDLAERAHVRDVTWTFGHIARGMYDAEGKIKPYSALSAIQVGFLLRYGALAWRADETAANGRDAGCFAIDFAKMPVAVEKLERVSLGVKARGDVALAKKLVADYVAPTGRNAGLLRTISERVLRDPSATFLYSVRVE
jgi:hypothetical protein